MPDVFISYSTDAKKWAVKLADSLRREGVTTWSDFGNLTPGARLWDQLEEALDAAKFYLVVVGPRKGVGHWQDREWQGALERTWADPDKRIIPVLVGHAEPPAFLSNWASIRFDPGRNESAWVKRIAQIIKSPPPRDQLHRERPGLGKDWRKRIRDMESTAKRLKSRQEPTLTKG